jgi:hypothetical protein
MLKMTKSNISRIHRLVGYEKHLAFYLKFFNLYRRKYKNYIQVMRNVLRKKYPFTGINYDGTTKIFASYAELYNDLMRIGYEPGEDLVYVDDLAFYGGKTNGDIVGIFRANNYSELPVKDRVVLDIGANIGDSAIYFAIRGAKKVLAIEPDKMCYEFAVKNIEANGLSDAIKIIHGAIVSPNNDNKGNPNFILLTLQDMIKNYNMNPTVCKIDCEGCEYETILNAPREVLRNFAHLKIEYHYGYRNLVKKLKSSGFLTRHTWPTYCKPRLNLNTLTKYYSGNQWERISSFYVGWIQATKI